MSNPCELNDCIDPAVHDDRLRMKLWPLLLLGLLALLLALMRGCGGGVPDLRLPVIENPNNGDTINDLISLSGTGEPNRFLQIFRDGVSIGGVNVSSAGEWSFIDRLATPGDHEYTVRHSFAGEDYDFSDSVNVSYVPASISAPNITGPADSVNPGNVLLFGTGEPGSRIQILQNGEVIGETIVRSDGSWNYRLDLPNTGDYEFTARALDSNSNPGAEGNSFLVSVVDPSDGAEPLIIDSPPLLGDVSRVGAGQYRVPISLTGTGEPGATVRLWVGDNFLGRTTVGDDGNWSFDGFRILGLDTPYQVRGLMEDADNVLLSRANGDTIRLTTADVASTFSAPRFRVSSADGECTISGTTEPNFRVRLISNGNDLAEVDVDENGNFSHPFTCPDGDYNFIVHLLDADGGTLAESNPFDFNVTSAGSGGTADGEGALQVLFADGSGGAGGSGSTILLGGENDPAVGIILDASWSMRNPELAANAGIDRIDIAKEALNEIVTEAIPDGTIVALRSFGNIEGNLACRTDNMYPAQPVDKAELLGIVDEIEPQFNANTPIAESLLRMGDDMAGIDKQKIIILLTDGLETCDGDVSAAIQTLTDQGIDVRIDVVGVGVEEEDVRAEFENWALEGGGVFYDARSAGDISDAFTNIFERSFPVAYVVTASDGSSAHVGVVGEEPVALPAGSYTVSFPANPTETFDVEVTDGETTVVEVE